MSLSDFLPQRRPVWVLMTASAVCSLIVLDTNIVAVSLPAIARSLNAGFADLEWVVSAYMLAFAACLLPAGSIADRWGRRRTMLVGLVGFILASLACGAAETTTAMNIARAIKGVGSALLLTSALAVIGHTFHEERERMRAWSFWGGCMGLAMTIAPVFGGIVTAWLGWRWIFYLNLPIGLLLLTLVWRCIEESRDPQAARLDPLGSLCFSAGLFGVIWALIGGSEAGWTSTATLGRAGAGVLLLMLFIVVEMRQQRPMVDLALFRSPRFIGAVLAMFGYATSAQVMMTFLPLYMQNAFGYTSVGAGLAMLPFAISMVIWPRIGPWLGRHLPMHGVLVLGLVLVGIGNAVTALAAPTLYYGWVALGMLVTGAGAGLLNGDTQKNIMACVPRTRTGMASGISTTTRFTGIVLAVGGLGGVLATRTRAMLDSGTAPADADFVQRVLSGDALQATLALPPALRDSALALARDSFAHGFASLLGAAAIVALLSALAVHLLMREQPLSRPSTRGPRPAADWVGP